MRPFQYLREVDFDPPEDRAPISLVHDGKVAGILALVALLLNGLSLAALEFFRHTEADRTLISWGMYSTGDYLVPSILGSPILTKPPAFYWLQSMSISVFGTTAEWAARAPSPLFAALLTAVQYLFLRAAGGTIGLAMLGAVMIMTGGLYLELANVAEIDMTYGAFAAMSFACLYIALDRQSLRALLFGYLFCAIGFLVKGPPIVAFFLATAVLSHLWIATRSSSVTKPSLRWIVVVHLLSAAILVAIIGAWIALLTDRVGVDALWLQFKTEIVERIVIPSHRRRGALFYVVSLCSALLPWSLVALLSNISPTRRELGLSWVPPLLVPFLSIAVCSGVFLLSLAEGKSTRYLFPLFAPAMALATIAIANSRSHTLSYRIATVAGFIAVGLSAGLPFAFEAPFISRVTLTMAAGVLGVSALVLALNAQRRSALGTMASVLLLVAAIRFGEQTVFAPLRNVQHGVIPLASEIDAVVPKSAPIHTVEIFERWIPYYLQRAGRTVERATPSTAASIASSGGFEGRAYLLLTHIEEFWRVLQLQSIDTTTRIIFDSGEREDHVLVVECDARALPYLFFQRELPVVPSEPFYAELKENPLDV
ncbi:MAG: glycosyltransferase family 39 protein [Deltaproteobacteria bacterium]|nr:glycosyltransferase family 39 protein [Deltaproteobacteria bacterium]